MRQQLLDATDVDTEGLETAKAELTIRKNAILAAQKAVYARVTANEDVRNNISRKADDIRKQSGLELDIVDHINATERSVSTLSGGESFLASLARSREKMPAISSMAVLLRYRMSYMAICRG